MQKKYFKIIAVIMIVSCLFSCKSNYNLSKSVECLGVNIPVEEGSVFDVQREQETIVNNEDAIVLMDKDLKSSTNHDDGDYSFNALYKSNNNYYTIFVYGEYDSVLQNKEWIAESLKNVSFS